MANLSNRLLLADYLGGNSSGNGSGRNYIKNSSAFYNVNNITAGGSASITRNTSSPLTAISDIQIAMTTNSDTATWPTNSFDNSEKNGNCMVSFDYTASLGTGATVVANVILGSSTVASTSLSAASSSTPVVINYACGDLSQALTVQIAQTAISSGTTTLHVANVYAGRASNIAVIGASKVATIAAGALCTTSPCTITRQSPSNWISSVTRASAGNYTVNFTSGIFSVPPSCQFMSGQVSVQFNGSATSSSVSITTLNSSLAATDAMDINVVCTPGVSQVVEPNLQAMSYMGYVTDCSSQPTATGNGASSGSGIDYNLPSSCTLNSSVNNNIGTVSLGSTATSINWTPKKAGTYRVTATFAAYNNTASHAVTHVLTDGSNNILNSQPNVSLLNVNANATISALFVASDTSQKTFKIKSNSSNGDALYIVQSTFIDSRYITWIIEDISQNLPAPYIVGQVSSSTSGQERIERMTFAEGSGTPCSASPCTINRQSGGISSVVRNGTGDYTINFISGTFSGPMTCTFAVPGIAQVSNTVASSTQFSFKHYNTSFSPLDIYNANVICMGPK